MRIELTSDLTQSQLDKWQRFLANARTSHPEQDPRFAPVLRADGNDVAFAMGWKGDDLVAVALFSLRPHPFLKGRYSDAMTYSGPVCDDLAQLLEFVDQLQATDLFRKVGRVRITPYWLDDDATRLAAALAKTGWHVFEAEPVRQTGLIDLTGTLEDVLSRYSKSARKEVRKAEQQGVTLEVVHDREGGQTFLTSLNQHRADRGMAPIPAAGFFSTLEHIQHPDGPGIMFALRHQGQFIAGLTFNHIKGRAHSVHFTNEASKLHELRNLRIAPYLWLQGIKWARDKGCSVLDVEGYRVSANPSDKMANIYKYKSEFSPRHVYRVAGHVRVSNAFVHLTGNAREIAKARVKAALARLPRKNPAPADQPNG